MQGDKWRRAFLQVAAAVGVHAQQSSEPQLDAVLAAVANLQQSELRLQVCTWFWCSPMGSVVWQANVFALNMSPLLHWLQHACVATQQDDNVNNVLRTSSVCAFCGCVACC
jgi:hypothetical protein